MPKPTFDALAVREEDLPNFQMVSSELFRGGQPNRAGFTHLKNLGVQSVINLRDERYDTESEEQLVKALGLHYFSIALSPFSSPPAGAIENFLQIALHTPYQPVFVHCLHGMDRTGTMVSIYRIEAHGWSLDKAYEEMLHMGFHAEFSKLSDAVRLFANSKSRA